MAFHVKKKKKNVDSDLRTIIFHGVDTIYLTH